jgi:pantoate--beta-alanine ligase
LYTFHTAESLTNWLSEARKRSVTIGFVPTMGALHEGHLSLIEAAKKKCDIVVCSIFVNPTQFNNAADLVNYPRTPEKDLELLRTAHCDAVYVPEITDIYPNFPNQTTFVQLNLHPLDQVMEGAFRPGHFDGVVNVVWRLFDIVQPQMAFFGMKDFQQVAVIRHMVNTLNLPVEIVACPTSREKEGLAKSSRNLRLSENQKKEALILHHTLRKGKEVAGLHSPATTKTIMQDFFNTGTLTLEYIEIVHPTTLEPLHENWVSGAVACIAAFCGDVRLIDNLQLID